MRKEIVFSGSPHQFGVAVQLSEGELALQAGPWRFSVETKLEADTNPVNVQFMGLETEHVNRDDIETPEQEIERLIPPIPDPRDPTRMYRPSFRSPTKVQEIYEEYEATIRMLEGSGWRMPLPEYRQPMLRITAQSLPKAQSLLIVEASDEHWPKVQSWWEALARVLEQQGWIEPSQSTATRTPHGALSEKQKRHVAWRPHFPENAWAYDEVNLRGRKPADVFSEWRSQRRAKGRPDPDDFYDSFMKAIRPKK